MVGNGRMHHLSRFVLHEDKNIERFEEEGVNDCEITSPHFAGMILEKRLPILTCSSPSLFHVLTNGVFVKLDTQFEQLPPESSSPSKVDSPAPSA